MKLLKGNMESNDHEDQSLVWKPSDTYVNWCQIIVGDAKHLQKLYESSGDKKRKSDCFENEGNKGFSTLASSVRKKSCPCASAVPDTNLARQSKTRGPCSLEELNQWNRVVELMDLKRKCAELHRRLQTETFYKCRVAMTQDCKKQVFDCPCVPRNSDSYVKDRNKRSFLDGDKKKKGKHNKGKQGGKTNGKHGNGDATDSKENAVGGAECIEYKLSESDQNGDRSKTVQKFFTFQTEPFCFDKNYFKVREYRERHCYKDGTTAAIFNCDGTGVLYYPNGETAITVTKGKLGCRFTVMSKSGHDERGEYYTTSTIAMFDSKGNGVVYDKDGKIRMNYDQAEGIIYDTPSGVPVRWQWELYKFVVKRREQLQGVPEDPVDNETSDENLMEEMISSDKENKNKKPTKKNDRIGLEIPGRSAVAKNPFLTTGQSFINSQKTLNVDDWTALNAEDIHEAAVEPKPIAMKLNQFLSLRILKQSHVHLDFRPFPLHFHFNLGIKLKPEIIERIDKVSETPETYSEVPCYFELLHTRTKSLQNIHSDLEKLRNSYKIEERINFVKRAKLMGVLKYITQMTLNKLNKKENKLSLTCSNYK